MKTNEKKRSQILIKIFKNIENRQRSFIHLVRVRNQNFKNMCGSLELEEKRPGGIEK